MGQTPLVGKSGKGLAGRSLVAVLLFVGYYVLSLAVAAALFGLAYAQTVIGIHSWVTLWACILAGGAVLLSIVPRVDRFVAPGPRLSPEAHPRLFEEIDRVARALRQKPPREVYLIAEPNAGVQQRGGLMGIGSRRVMIVGLTYFQVLTVEEFRSVLAHEFGHFWGGDTKLGPWIYKTRANIGRTIETLGEKNPPNRRGTFWSIYTALRGFAMKLFELYGNMFLRVTSGISRRQEFVADRLAAACAGREATISGLRKGEAAGMAYAAYWQGPLSRVLNAGFRPPFAAGFGSFIESEPIKQGMAQAVAAEMETGSTDPYDSHPCLKERIEALNELEAGRAPGSAGEPAITLLGDSQELERELFRSLDPDKAEELTPIAWDEVLEPVYFPFWGSLAQKHASELAGITLGNLPETAANPETLGARMAETAGAEATPEEVKAYTAYVIYAATCSKLVKLGWKATAPEIVGYVTLARGDLSWEPRARIEELISGAMSAEAWRELCARLDIAEVELADAAAPAPTPAPGPVTPPASSGRSSTRARRFRRRFS